ncbi:MAG: hypothetical protein HOW73_04040 [Polyangiaceae bacterium]|nr:hypothetical protein [Polyangiaceae bacterium]
MSDNCCECAGRPVGQQAPQCDDICLVNQCTSLAVTGSAKCVAGRCVAPANCDEAEVKCLVDPPVCAPGTAPIVAGACYSGGCMPVTECTAVTECADCVGDDVTCVQHSAMQSTRHCVDIASPCSEADCGCLGPSVCTDPYTACSETDTGLNCACPVCAN